MQRHKSSNAAGVANPRPSLVPLSLTIYTSHSGRGRTTTVCALALLLWFATAAYPWAIDCQVEPGDQDYTGVRYKAFLAEQELSETGWMLLFMSSGFTSAGEYEPHFVDLMLKASWCQVHEDGLCASGWPVAEHLDEFGFEIGLSDYEDWGNVLDNDIAMWSRDAELFPRRFTNIDSTEPGAPDKIMAEYQVGLGGLLEGAEIIVTLIAAEETTLPSSVNYYADPDAGCAASSHADILYRHWIVTFEVPAKGVGSTVDLYVNASEASRILRSNTLNLLWESPVSTDIENDRLRIIIFDPEVRLAAGAWVSAERFLVDWRTSAEELPVADDGSYLGGFRKVCYKGRPAIDASFGYGYLDYIRDGNPTQPDPNSTKGVIDLSYLSLSFPDVPPEHWAWAEVNACVISNIVWGYADGLYHPEQPVTRDQMAVCIARALAGGDQNVPDAGCSTPLFTDVACDHWARKYVQYAVAEGVVQGYPEGEYRPDETVDRGQMAVYIARAFELPL